MKHSKLILGALIFSSIMFTSCKEAEHDKMEENIVEESTVNKVSNASDEHFSKAISELEAKKNKEAAAHIKEGIEAIKKEEKNEGGLYKVNLDNAIQELDMIAKQLEENKNVSLLTLKETIANAEINVAHDYLATTQVYTLEEPEIKNNNSNIKHLKHNLTILKDKEVNKIKEETKKEREALLNEGKKLEDEMKALHEKMKVHTKKTDEHIKKNYPEIYEEWIWIN